MVNDYCRQQTQKTPTNTNKKQQRMGRRNKRRPQQWLGDEQINVTYFVANTSKTEHNALLSQDPIDFTCD